MAGPTKEERRAPEEPDESTLVAVEDEERVAYSLDGRGRLVERVLATRRIERPS